ncbi:MULTISPECIES: hypothetical protein [unclassified Pseudomonas]|uniref:hypothetical protein n=1 Tax=unclassified Pseudomonas TaxID=196821 RepID=UPI0015B1FC38|nr:MULTISPECIES: hypothetical protein [unclassified Pseudomonas]
MAWPAGGWLFFDQAFLPDFEQPLSTFLLSQAKGENTLDKPVDKSVTKLWKDSPRQRRYWLEAIPRLTVRLPSLAGAAWTPCPGQAKNFLKPPAAPVDSGLQTFALAPKDCGASCG